MDFFSSFPDIFNSPFSAAWFLFIHGGFLAFLYAFLWISWELYMDHIHGKFASSLKWINLHIKIEKANLQSTLAVEQIFFQLHASASSFSWANKYLEGQFQTNMSLELVSIGGKVSYLVRCTDKLRNLVETAFYAYYPNAEISLVEDYMQNLASWDPLTSNWDLWGTEYGLTKDWAYPIKTYRQFEHPAAEEKIIDPLAGMLEALGKTDSHELLAVQLCIRPKGDGEWQPHVKEMITELKGEKKAPVPGFWKKVEDFLNPMTWILRAIHGAPAVKKEDAKVPAAQRLTEGEKRILTAVEEKMTKTGWDTKIRMLYVAPKDKFDGTKRTAVIGAFRQFSGMVTNGLKPEIGKTGTAYGYKFFKNLEKPYLEYQVVERKKKLLKGFVERSMWIGLSPFVLNNEEIATLFHFPLATVIAAPVETIDVKKGSPPPNLPVIG